MNHICIPTEKCLQREVGIYILSMKSAAAPELYCAGLLFDLKKAAAAQLFWGKVECGVCVCIEGERSDSFFPVQY